jgi:hypothetical protein
MKLLTIAIFAVALCAALLLHPAQSRAWSVGKYAISLSNTYCGSQNTAYQNGCRYYFAYRLKQTKDPAGAKNSCQTKCGQQGWSDANINRCKTACEAMMNGE